MARISVLARCDCVEIAASIDEHNRSNVDPGHDNEDALTARTLRFGLLTMQYPPWASLRQRWVEYERMGFDSLWLCDHFTGQAGEPLYKAWTLLTALARVTRRVRLGTVVTCASFRHPALLANGALTLDHVSGGRLEIGLGAGWWLPEFPRYGYPTLTAAERVAHFAETVETVSQLVTASNHAVASSVPDRRPPMLPAAIQQPRPPLMLAAQGPRMLALVARYGDAWVGSFGLSPAEVAARNRHLDDLCSARDRDPASLRRSLVWTPWVAPSNPWHSPAAFSQFVEAYREAGITEFILEEPPAFEATSFQAIVAETVPRLRALLP